ncbi:acriflavin resistance protein [Bradyrhizobium sp. BWA-3-5]|uniref:acriflavin resistance protein n=1 Tax=Bradyrhizobium sp. BWA-3-5 TaxID=3080013 RepID=UPI00293E6482|nr:acriflavin resistance protein [Bradyrhizobium sp. BWA-3-5]WOH63419.1 acriflavin resistance protein [Bradyrhizobium sp. BWA-3-5]
MNITTPLLTGAGHAAQLPGDSMTSLLRSIGFSDGADGGLGIAMSALSGVAAALAVAIMLSVYFRTGHRSRRDVVRHGLAASAVFVLLAFVVVDLRQAAQAYLGLNPAKPAVEFEIRLPKGTLTTAADTQIELLTDRNQKLAKLQEALRATDDGHSILRGTVTLDYRTTERVMLLNLPGQAQSTFRLRLPASPSRSQGFGPWHLADGIVPVSGGTVTTEIHDTFAIRYRVL